MDDHREARSVRGGRHAREVEAGPKQRAAPEPPLASQPVAPASVTASPPPAAPAPQPVVIARPDPLVLARGALLAGRYRLTTRLSAGAADVWRAEDELLGRAVALKVAVAATQGPAAAARLMSEARALAAVRHPNVVALFDVLTGPWGTALVLEVLPGETLAARLSRDGPVSAPIAISIAMQLAAALEAVHQGGLVHRDVKPGNVVIRPDGAVRLIDFGIARPAGDRHGLTPAGKVEGTLRSISPEQLAGGPVTPATDLFGLGTVLFELLEGRPPFDATDPEQLTRLHRLGRPPVILAPPPLADLLSRLLEPNPAARPPSAAAVLDQLRAIGGVLGRSPSSGHGPAPAPRRSATQAQGEPPRRARFRLRSVVVGGVMAVVLAAGVTLGLPPGTGTAEDSQGQAGAESSPRRSGTPIGAVAARTAAPASTAGSTPRPTPKPTAKPTTKPAPTRTPRPTAATTFGVDHPGDGDRTTGSVVLVRGHAPPGATITRDVPLWFDQHAVADRDGHWSMEVALSAGENRLTFRLGDDRSTEAVIRVTSDPSRARPVSGG